MYHVLCPIVLPSYHCIVSFLLDFCCKQGFNYCTVHSSHILASFWLPLFISYLRSLKTESLDDANTVLIGLTIIITQLYHDFQTWSFRHQFKTWKCFFFMEEGMVAKENYVDTVITMWESAISLEDIKKDTKFNVKNYI